MRIDRIEDLKKEILESDVVASETLRWALKQDEYKDTTRGEIQYLLNWSGDDEYVNIDDLYE